MPKKISIWDIIAWIVLAGILVWLLLKSFGIINTSIWLEYAPLYGAVYIAGWQIHKLKTVAEEVHELKRFKEATINEIHSIKHNCLRTHNR
jgi:hypothetical protein